MQSMPYKHFYRAILSRLLIIILLAAAATFLYVEMQMVTFSVLMVLLLIGAVINIISYFNKINHWIASFLMGIENDDTTLKTPRKSGNKAIDEIYKAIDRLNEIFKKTKIDINTQEQYFRSVIDQSATGLFSVNEKGRVVNINPAATKLTQISAWHHINTLLAIDAALPAFIMESSGKSQQSAIFENKYGQKLLFKLSEIKTHHETIKLVAVSDITKELDNREIDAWIKLARTLAHEIMNNIAPITSLTQVISGYFTANDQIIKPENVDATMIANTVKGLGVIEERGVGLMRFVENYRKFTKLPEPHFRPVDISGLIERALLAASAYPGFVGIQIRKSLPENLMLTSDEQLLSQVILNLMKNASEALIASETNMPFISLKLTQFGNTIKLEIANNGPPIPPEIKEQIFVPFYTTKENGSGIGLSLSRQIILQMGGDISVSESRDGLTIFAVNLVSRAE
ncbi:MAG: GHKL domain-containing protein [Bacteroidales bacterium]|nr:GHKL domain-containing protein [Bacteroidales bacterium]